MPKRIQVNCNDGGPPGSFRWRGKKYAVAAVLERWRDTGRWWEGEAPKIFFRLQTPGGGLWEIYLDTGEAAWYLYKIYD
ncbi:MAG: hypothetical protein D9V47_11540 [Clostridia bacterium]|nr:MAG: hypothetical protein D9V47_11540 [Clostridia bacterium]